MFLSNISCIVTKRKRSRPTEVWKMLSLKIEHQLRLAVRAKNIACPSELANGRESLFRWCLVCKNKGSVRKQFRSDVFCLINCFQLYAWMMPKAKFVKCTEQMCKNVKTSQELSISWYLKQKNVACSLNGFSVSILIVLDSERYSKLYSEDYRITR